MRIRSENLSNDVFFFGGHTTLALAATILLAEVGFELGQIKDIEELIDKMEDKRLEADCEFLRQQQQRLDN